MNCRYLFAFLFVTLCSSSVYAQNPKAVQVGVALRFAPEKNSFAKDLYEGMELAARQFNAKGGLQIELVKYAHKEGHDSVTDSAKKILKDKVSFVLGGEMSDDVFALVETFDSTPVLLITPTASNPLLTAGKPNVFRVSFSDDQVASLLAKYVAGMKSVKTLGALHNTSNAYSDYLTNQFLTELEKLRSGKNAIQLSEFRYASESPRFEGAVEQFKKAGVNLVVAFTLQESLKSFLSAAGAAKFDPELLGSDGWGTAESLSKSLPQLHGVRPEYWNSTSTQPAVVQFKKEIEKAYQHFANGWNAVGFDSAQVLFAAIDKAKNKSDVSEVREILSRQTVLGGVTYPSLSFGRNQTLKKPLYLFEFKNGSSRFLKQVE